MTVVESVLVGAMQGVTEFLPISSSAHLIAVPWLFKIDSGSVDKLMLSIPIVFGVSFYEARHVPFLQGGENLARAVRAFSAFISGVLTLTFFINYLRRHTIDVFACYRVVLAVVILVFIAVPPDGNTRRVDAEISHWKDFYR